MIPGRDGQGETVTAGWQVLDGSGASVHNRGPRRSASDLRAATATFVTPGEMHFGKSIARVGEEKVS
jgi:hypothetical protein